MLQILHKPGQSLHQPVMWILSSIIQLEMDLSLEVLQDLALTPEMWRHFFFPPFLKQQKLWQPGRSNANSGHPKQGVCLAAFHSGLSISLRWWGGDGRTWKCVSGKKHEAVENYKDLCAEISWSKKLWRLEPHKLLRGGVWGGGLHWGICAGRAQVIQGVLGSFSSLEWRWGGLFKSETGRKFPPLPTLTYPYQIPTPGLGLTSALVEKTEMEIRIHSLSTHRQQWLTFLVPCMFGTIARVCFS